MNESIYYNVDAIHRAIAENEQIRFKYFRWTEKKEQEFRHDGADYVVSPWGLVWDDDHFEARVDMALSFLFLGWIASMGDGIQIIAPDEAVEQMREMVKKLGEIYG